MKRKENLKTKLSGPREKILIALEAFVDSDYFQRSVEEFRLKFGIPASGYLLTTIRKKELIAKGLVHIPEELVHGTHLIAELTPDVREMVENAHLKPFGVAHLISEMTPNMRKILARAPYQSFGVAMFLRCYLFYDEFIYDFLEDFHRKNLLEIADPYNEAIVLYDEVKGHGEVAEYYLESEIARIQSHPIAIRIHPDASIRNIHSFLDANGKAIKAYQQKYKKEFSLIRRARRRKTSVKENERTIYKNRLRPIKAIRKILAESKVFLDESHITKVISLERKRRKQV